MRLFLGACLMSFAITAFAACSDEGPDALVGGACASDRDCEDRCLTGGNYPGGFCSVRCLDDLDCPDETICTDKDGGVCLYACDVSAHCDFLGPQYVCKDADDWAGRRVGVCLGN